MSRIVPPASKGSPDPEALLRAFMEEPVAPLPEAEARQLREQITRGLESRRPAAQAGQWRRWRPWIVFAAAACLPVVIWAAASFVHPAAQTDSAIVRALSGQVAIARGDVRSARSPAWGARRPSVPATSWRTGQDASAQRISVANGRPRRHRPVGARALLGGRRPGGRARPSRARRRSRGSARAEAACGQRGSRADRGRDRRGARDEVPGGARRCRGRAAGEYAGGRHRGGRHGRYRLGPAHAHGGDGAHDRRGSGSASGLDVDFGARGDARSRKASRGLRQRARRSTLGAENALLSEAMRLRP